MEENLKQQRSDIIKIAVLGPEGTGKTTLVKQLALHFDTVWAGDFAQNFNEGSKIIQSEDIMDIANGQIKLENDALLNANEYLFCDSCLMAIKIYSEIHFEFCDPLLDKLAKKHKYDLFFLTDIDVSWKKDNFDKDNDAREEICEKYKSALIESDKPSLILSGDEESRLEQAIKSIENLIKAREMNFTPNDFVQIEKKGIKLDTVQDHLNIFKTGAFKANLVKAATKNDGVIKLTDVEFEHYSSYFDQKKDNYKLKKFVPASGAASRMFKFLSEFLNEFDIENETINGYINRKKATNLTVFLTGLQKFPFFESVYFQLRELYEDFGAWESDKKNYHFIKLMLDPEYFDFCNKPKGILPFHKYIDHIATPIEEHLTESAFYASSNGVSHLHFTVSKAHQQQFEEIIEGVKNKVEQNSPSKIHINFSYQDSATDTIAVDIENRPLRNEQGKLVFRPGGHGALIENLNCLDGDIIFIKNIDNVIQNHIEKIALYKKGLAGILIELQQQVFNLLNQIENNTIVEGDIDSIIEFMNHKLNISLIEDFSQFTIENKITYIGKLLNRPIRVCGMVKNEGEPGGGPFWVRDQKGNVSLQIIETSQVDLQNSFQRQILESSTHFNPVDLVCGIKDFRGNKFDLSQFVDYNSGFIVDKNKNGKALKAYELPGLWNGSMAKWITVFVEVPLLTFNPVKTVNDLLKPAHQPQ